ncbi:MAG: holo-ACP synthase [Anaerolineae bacterium]
MRVGVDLVEVRRIEAAWQRWGDRFLSRIYSDAEQAASRGRVSSLAGRFAAKEATAKALGVGIGPIDWREVEVLSGDLGQPQLQLHGRALALSRQLGVHEWAVSLSDTAEHAIAVVVLT